MKGKQIKVAEHSPCPFGRYREHGQGSGEEFRDDVLIPALETEQVVTLDFTGGMTYPMSWAEEVFGGLIRSGKFTKDAILSRLNIITDIDYQRNEIIQIIKRT
ncbi:STAS-like domain-containing protein [Ectopseudomonas composti]